MPAVNTPRSSFVTRTTGVPTRSYRMRTREGNCGGIRRAMWCVTSTRTGGNDSMSVLDEYPKAHRSATAKLRSLLERVPDCEPCLCEEVARAINGIADKACDLEDIFQRLLSGPATADE